MNVYKIFNAVRTGLIVPNIGSNPDLGSHYYEGTISDVTFVTECLTPVVQWWKLLGHWFPVLSLRSDKQPLPMCRRLTSTYQVVHWKVNCGKIAKALRIRKKGRKSGRGWKNCHWIVSEFNNLITVSISAAHQRIGDSDKGLISVEYKRGKQELCHEINRQNARFWKELVSDINWV